MGSIHNAIGIWLCRYVFIYTLPMPSVLRYPHPTGLPKKSGTSLSVVPSSPKSLPRPVVVDAYKAATPSHTTLQHQPHTLDNHLKITSSKVRTITTPPHITDSSARKVQTLSPCFGRSRNIARAPFSASLDPIRPPTLLTRYNRTVITPSPQFTRLSSTSSLAALPAGSTLHGTFSRHHLIVNAHDLHLHLHHIHHILLLTHLAAFIWTVISCYSNHWSRDWPQRRLQRLFPSHQLPSFYTPLPHHNTTSPSTLTINTTPLCTHHNITTSPVRRNLHLLQLG
jgi:hypothetical protein